MVHRLLFGASTVGCGVRKVPGVKAVAQVGLVTCPDCRRRIVERQATAKAEAAARGLL